MNKKLKITIKLIAAIIILFVFIGTIVFLYTKSRKKPIVYQTKQPIVTDIIKKTVATGSVVPRKEITIKPRISGIIEKIYVEPGDLIEKDGLIAKIKIIPDMIKLNNAESRFKKSKINLNDAKKTYIRQKGLFDKKIISESKFLEYELLYHTAREEYESAEKNLQLIRDGMTQKSNQNTNTLIRSTINGTILEVPVKEGISVIETNTFNAGTTIAVVADMKDMIFNGKVDESEVGKIKLGMDLILSIGAIEDEIFDAKLEYISPKGIVENSTTKFEIRAKLKLNKKYFLRAGFSANADIVLDRKNKVLALNESLLQFEGEKIFVEIEANPNHYEKRYIETGLSDGINIEIKSGLTENEKIKVWNSVVK